MKNERNENIVKKKQMKYMSWYERNEMK